MFVGYHGWMSLLQTFLPSRPVRQAVLAQGLAAGLVALAPVLAPGWLTTLPTVALAQGVAAALISLWQRAPGWWPLIHLAFLPVVLGVSRLVPGLAPGWYLAGFVLLLLVYWRTDRSQVPLYLSNDATAAAVATLLPTTPCRVIDLGCGHAGLLRHLARLRPDARFVGIEHAPLPWLWAWLASRRYANLTIVHGDFWQMDLAPYDVVYVFLSPAPMPRLHQRVQAQMRPGTLLVSNSFAIPGRAADEQIEVADRRATCLYCYRLPASREK
jgi:SAM-dependent methyltransferase